MTTKAHDTKCQPVSDHAGKISYILKLELLIFSIVRESPIFSSLLAVLTLQGCQHCVSKGIYKNFVKKSAV